MTPEIKEEIYKHVRAYGTGRFSRFLFLLTTEVKGSIIFSVVLCRWDNS